MIKQIYSEPIFEDENYYSMKIKSLILAYGFSYDFCRFFLSDKGGVLCYYNDSVTVSGSFDNDELEQFFLVNTPFCVEIADVDFEPSGYKKIHRTLMKFVGEENNIDENFLEINGDLEKAFAVISDGFPDVIFDSWYVDLHRRIRQNVSKIIMYNGVATATMQFSFGEFAFFYMVATKKEERGKSYARNLLYYIANKLSNEGRFGYLFAKDERLSFYENIGFLRVMEDYIFERES